MAAANTTAHIPVLPAEVLAALAPRAGDTCLDCTAGLGGHAAALAPAIGPSGRIILNDLDEQNLRSAQARLTSLPDHPAVDTLRGNFAAAPRELAARSTPADLVLADLGFASNQVDDPARGLSFSKPGPLDMRLDPTSPTTAATLVATLSEHDLADVIYRYGEERFSRQVARRIVEARAQAPISTTDHLASIVRSAVRSSGQIDPATRTFQALRIAVNDELGNLEALLDAIQAGAAAAVGGRPTWLRPGARIAIISFHSLEDGLVKRAFDALHRAGLTAAAPTGPLQATEAETRVNPRSRSARLRHVTLRE